MPSSPAARCLATIFGLLLALVACGTLASSHEWGRSRGPVVPHDSFPADCRLCHVGEGWHEIREDFEFDHLQETGYALEGAHSEATCLLCHNDRGPVEVFAARGCRGCHVDTHLGKLGLDCSNCHGVENWVPREQIAQHARTRMPLVGAHAAAQCWQCHPGAQVGNFEGLDPNCVTCHTADLARATMPNHLAEGLDTDCHRCHLPLGWTPARFDHPQSFALVGGHAGRDCADCHTGNSFAGLSTDCASCHLDDYQATQNPSHAAAGIGTDCEMCHTVFQWGSGNFQHPPSFPLTGGHAGRDCSDCHINNVFPGTPTDCYACHATDYASTIDPNHQAFGFPTSCEVCHNTSSWQNADFNHTFPIDNGPHSAVSCMECHRVPSSTAFSCIDCHEHNRADTDRDHEDVPGYVYASANCFACHPLGR